MIVEESDKEPSFKLHELRCFDAVIRLGSFQAAAAALNRSHPSVFAAVSRLEEGTGLALLDRSGYRVGLTAVGRAFHAEAVATLREAERLNAFVRQTRLGEETVLRIVLGDLCPRSLVLPVLSAFFVDHRRTRLHLDYEAIGGPAERLRSGSADLIFHRAKAADMSLEHIDLGEVRLVPVAAPGYVPLPAAGAVTPDDLRPLTQCVIRDTARAEQRDDHFLIAGAQQCSVADHGMKKELILQRLAWGHLPDFMIANELLSGELISLHGPALPGGVERLAVMRQRDRPHGPVASALWDHLRATLAS